MAYKLEHVPSDHMALLVETMHKWSNSQPDVYIISEEGHKIYTHKLLVGFYSPTLGSILNTGSTNDMPAISIPASSNSIVNLLKVLATGIAISNNKADLLAVSKAAEAISIEMENWQIGVKNRGGANASKNDNKKNKKTVQKSTSKNITNLPVKQESVENSEEKKYSCPDCGKSFGRKDHLNRHATTHSDVVYPCNICGSSFKRKDGLKHHLSKVHDTELAEEDDPLLSTKVKVENTDEENLGEVDAKTMRDADNDDCQDGSENQIVGETDNPEKSKAEEAIMEENCDDLNYVSESKYKCNQCEKVFKNPQHLRRHEAVHSGIKFSCNFCESTFSRKDKLTAHMRKKHSQVAYDDSLPYEPAAQNEDDQNQIEAEVEETAGNDAVMESSDISPNRSLSEII